MDQYQAKISISLETGTFEVAGSEEFVKQQIKEIKELIEKHGRPAHKRADSKGSGETTVKKDQQPDGIDNVFSFEGEEVSITADLPGSNKAQKTVNLALLYLYGKSIHSNKKDSGANEIRQLCRDHGCLDEANFASTLKKEKAYFVVKGKGKNPTVKLTTPGLKRAKEIVKELNASETS